MKSKIKKSPFQGAFIVLYLYCYHSLRCWFIEIEACKQDTRHYKLHCSLYLLFYSSVLTLAG